MTKDESLAILRDAIIKEVTDLELTQSAVLRRVKDAATLGEMMSRANFLKSLLRACEYTVDEAIADHVKRIEGETATESLRIEGKAA